MIHFNELGSNVYILRDTFSGMSMPFCEMSLGEKYLWREAFVVDYASVEDGYILKESSQEYGYKDAFYYPNRPENLQEIEKYAEMLGIPLTYCYISQAQLQLLRDRYPLITASYDRDTSDYFYLAEDFRHFRGKKFSGQRNHINKFLASYPNARFKKLEPGDYDAIVRFISKYQDSLDSVTHLEGEELSKLPDFINSMCELGVVGGVIYVDCEVIALTLGEVVGDTLIVHVEKALREYQGVYPTLARELVRSYATDDVKYINREEDCGVIGLRTSKMQYHPIEIKHKYLVKVDNCYGLLQEHVSLTSERLTIDEITQEDKDDYYALYLDRDVNEYYGYDYREDAGDIEVTPQYFYDFQQGLKAKREEYSLAVRLDGRMIGEVVLYNADFLGKIEIGFRFFTQHQHKGYAYEATSRVLRYLKERGYKRVTARHYPINQKSQQLLTKLGFSCVAQGDRYYFYEYQL